MMKNIKISVVTVCYNASKTIENTIKSVVNQTYSDIEYIIIDGVSKDNTLEIIDKYKDIISKVISEPDKGIYDAINKGLEQASGDFLIVLGADDKFYTEKTLELVSKFLQNDETVYYGNVFRPIRKDTYCGKFNSYKLAVKNLPHQALFYPKMIYKSMKYDLRYRIFADYAYNIELWKKYKFEYIPITVTNYYDGASSATQNDEDFDTDYKELVCSNLGVLQYYYATTYHFLRNLIKKGR